MQFLSALLPLFTAMLYLCIGIAVYFLSKDTLRKHLLKFCYLTFHWQFSWFVLFYFNSSQYANLLCKIGYTGIIFLPISTYATVAHYLNHSTKTIKYYYYLCFGFLLSLWTTDYFIQDAYKHSYGYYPEAGFLHTIYVLMVSILVLQNIFTLCRSIFKEEDRIRKYQLKFILLASFIFSLSAIDYFLNYPLLSRKLSIDLYPFGVFFITFSVLIFILSHFITLNLTLEKRVKEKTKELMESYGKLEQARKMEALGRLAGGVAHDLNNILTGMVGYPDLILSELDESAPIRDNIIMIKKAGEKAAAVVNDLLILTRKGALTMHSCNINFIINETIKSPEIKRILEEKPNVKIIFSQDQTIPEILGSSLHLSRVFLNLIQNALEATNDFGLIKIVSKCGVLNKQIEGYATVMTGNYLMIEISDNGVGIAKDKVRKIFEPFYTSKKMSSDVGTGLGLSIVWSTLIDHRGYIDVTSEINVGTTFTLYFPLKENKVHSEYRLAS